MVMVRTKNRVETAATTGLISYFNEVKIWTGSLVILPVVRKRAMMNSFRTEEASVLNGVLFQVDLW